MTEDEAREVELVRAVELEDTEAVLLTREDRQQADGHARSREPAIEERASEHRFLAQRAEFAAARLTTRRPGIAELLDRTGCPRCAGGGWCRNAANPLWCAGPTCNHRSA